jgi:DNA/RNA-binding domain of Phe-tRNA-synthetase-like protein
MTELRIEPAVLARFPDTMLGVVLGYELDNHGEHSALMASLRAAEGEVRSAFADVVIIDHPHIAPWREAYRAFGAKPKDYPSSIENLVRRISKGHALPHINTLVDLYNTVSLRHLLPVGGEDLAQVRGDIRLTVAAADEPAVKLLGEAEARPPKAGEVMYTDEVGAICRRWNWKEAERTKLTEETSRAVLVIEGLPPVDRPLIEHALADMAELVRTYCGGTVTTAVLNAEQPRFHLDG